MTERLYLGLDIGAAFAKAVMIDESATAVGTAVMQSGIDFQAAAAALQDTLHQTTGTGPARIDRTVACGYGRRNVATADETKTEIACHAKGAHHFAKRACTVLDIGGQDSKVIRVNDNGDVRDFRMNRKCAAGTGAFVEEMARRMGVPLETLSSLAEGATVPAPISAFCTVFAGTEILAAARKGTPKAAIALGIYVAVVERAMSLADLSGDVVLTGGLAAHHPVFERLLGDKLEGRLFRPPLPQYTGAWGAALFARESGGRLPGEIR